MFNSLDEYKAAIAAVGVKKVQYATLMRKYPQFASRSREAFEQLLKTEGLSFTRYMYRNQHLGYINVDSQSLWCAWTSALLYVPGFRRMGGRDAAKEAALFVISMKSYGTEVTIEDLQPGKHLSAEVGLLWKSWNEALAFGMAL